ncbi:MAG: permease-like cell division protein FtsX [Propionibacteriaceae bacterium]|jgi:cell division transport system permease protein|nr:permease-like cell division protein FtsX [Propionibacteriaceae bacterium]
MRHVFREALSGIRRNGSMTVAVIITMWVSLTLFGVGLLAAEQVELTKGRWYDKIEISVFLCVKTSKASNCEQGSEATQAQKDEIRTTLENNPEVDQVYYETKAEAYEDFRAYYANSPVLATLTEADMQDSFRVKLINPEQYQGVVSAVTHMKGVETVQDLHTYLDSIFAWLNMARWATIGASAVLLIAAALQIGNTIRMAAFNRRRELGIMRLVGASNWYILLPFLMEALISAIMGALLACGTLVALEESIIRGKARVEIGGDWIDLSHVQSASLILGLVAVVLSVIPTLVATRRFLRV